MRKYVKLNIQRPDPEVIQRYSEFDVSTVYEAQGKQGLMSHVLRPVISGGFVCGPVVTATCYASDNLMIHAAIEACQPGDVLVVSVLGAPDYCGMVGELLVLALMKRGVKGLVIDSGVRDVEHIRELGFPVWSRAIYSQGTTKVRGGWVNAPAVCGGVEVSPGDLVLANDDGIVVVSKDDLASTEELTRKRMAKEDQTKQRIANGELGVDFYGLRDVLKKENVIYVD